MPAACCLIRDQPHYHHGQFVTGLKALGFEVSDRIAARPTPGDVLLIWNRSGVRDHYAKLYEAAGAKVIVAENGWIGQTGTGGKFYALCLGHHNGTGAWRVGEADRFPLLNVGLKPWRESGNHIVALCSRGIGEAGVAQPREWPRQIAKRLAAATDRPVTVRPHPATSGRPLEPDLEGAHAVVTWASGAAVKAIAAGIPAFYELKGWIGGTAARHGLADIDDPFLGDRLPMFRRLAWAQWTAAEIASGEAFRWLLKSRST